MTETTDCQEQRLTVVLLQYSIPSKQWFIQLLPQALFLLVRFLYNLITSQRNPLMLMEHLLYQNCLHPHLPSLHRKQREKVCLMKFSLVFKMLHCITLLVQSMLVLEFKDYFSFLIVCAFRAWLLFWCVYFPPNPICCVLHNFKLTLWYLLFTALFCKLTFQMIIWKMYFVEHILILFSLLLFWIFATYLSCHVVTQLESHFGPLCFMSCCYCLECQCQTFQSIQAQFLQKARVFYIFLRTNLFWSVSWEILDLQF